MEPAVSPPRVFDYLDFRKYLRDLLEFSKQANSHFSHRFVSQRLGLRSSGFFLYVLQGKRKLSVELSHRVADLFKLRNREHEYFILLVNYGQASSQKAKQFYYEQILARRKKDIRRLGSGEYELYEKWYYPVVREAVEILRIRDQYELLAKSLVPPITPSQARESLEKLSGLGLIRLGSRGWYERTDRVISTGDQWESAAIHNVQIEYADLGKEALDRIAREDRDISCLTISVSRKNFDRIREKVKELRGEILEVARGDEGAEGVYQCNFQLFPVMSEKGNGQS